MVAMARGSVRARASTNDEDAMQSSPARAAGMGYAGVRLVFSRLF